MVLVELVNKSNITLEVVVTTVGLGRSYEVVGPRAEGNPSPADVQNAALPLL